MSPDARAAESLSCQNDACVDKMAALVVGEVPARSVALRQIAELPEPGAGHG